MDTYLSYNTNAVMPIIYYVNILYLLHIPSIFLILNLYLIYFIKLYINILIPREVFIIKFLLVSIS